MANEVIAQVSDVLIGAYGQSIGGCTSIGGCESAEISSKSKAGYATDNRGRKKAGWQSDPEYQIVLAGLTAIQKQNVAYALGAVVSGNELKSDGPVGAMTELTCFVTGLFSDGVIHTLHAQKVVIPAGGSWKQSADPTKLDLTVEMFYDESAPAGERYWVTSAGSVDTTPPTVSTVTPADDAVAVSKAATTVVDWVFSEAIRAEDVHDRNFWVAGDDDVLKPGTVAVLDAANTTVRFTPTTAWGATTKYHPTANAGVRDVAGNRMAAQKITCFTTGA